MGGLLNTTLQILDNDPISMINSTPLVGAINPINFLISPFNSIGEPSAMLQLADVFLLSQPAPVYGNENHHAPSTYYVVDFDTIHYGDVCSQNATPRSRYPLA